MTFNRLIQQQSVDGFNRLLKSVKALESNQVKDIRSASGTVSSPPTSLEIAVVFDTPANIGEDFLGLIIDSTNGNEWLCWCDGTSWYVLNNGAGIGARVYNTTNISLGAVAATVTFNSERFDTSNFHSTSVNTGRLTIPADGIYMINATVEFDAGNAGNRNLTIRLDGTTGIARNSIDVGTETRRLTISTIYQFTANQYIELRASQTGNLSLDIVASNNISPEFSIAKF